MFGYVEHFVRWLDNKARNYRTRYREDCERDVVMYREMADACDMSIGSERLREAAKQFRAMSDRAKKRLEGL